MLPFKKTYTGPYYPIDIKRLELRGIASEEEVSVPVSHRTKLARVVAHPPDRSKFPKHGSKPLHLDCEQAMKLTTATTRRGGVSRTEPRERRCQGREARESGREVDYYDRMRKVH